MKIYKYGRIVTPSLIAQNGEAYASADPERSWRPWLPQKSYWLIFKFEKCNVCKDKSNVNNQRCKMEPEIGENNL